MNRDNGYFKFEQFIQNLHNLGAHIRKLSTSNVRAKNPNSNEDSRYPVLNLGASVPAYGPSFSTKGRGGNN